MNTRCCFIVVILSVSCMALPTRFRAKRNTWNTNLKRAALTDTHPDTGDYRLYQVLISEVYTFLGKSPRTGLTSHDIADFFENNIGKDPHIAENFGSDYIFWGDKNNDNRLSREELYEAMKVHDVFRYI